MTENELRAKLNVTGRNVSKEMQQAVIDVIVNGMTWRRAAIKSDVTESGIYRCMKRFDLMSTDIDTVST